MEITSSRANRTNMERLKVPHMELLMAHLAATMDSKPLNLNRQDQLASSAKVAVSNSEVDC